MLLYAYQAGRDPFAALGCSVTELDHMATYPFTKRVERNVTWIGATPPVTTIDMSANVAAIFGRAPSSTTFMEVDGPTNLNLLTEFYYNLRWYVKTDIAGQFDPIITWLRPQIEMEARYPCRFWDRLPSGIIPQRYQPTDEEAPAGNAPAEAEALVDFAATHSVAFDPDGRVDGFPSEEPGSTGDHIPRYTITTHDGPSSALPELVPDGDLDPNEEGTVL